MVCLSGSDSDGALLSKIFHGNTNVPFRANTSSTFQTVASQKVCWEKNNIIQVNSELFIPSDRWTNDTFTTTTYDYYMNDIPVCCRLWRTFNLAN